MAGTIRRDGSRGTRLSASDPDASRASPSPRARPTVPIVALVLGFLLAASWAEARDSERAARPRRERLARLVASRQAQTDGLERRLAGLRAQLESAGGASAALGGLRADVERLEALAGRAPMAGPGVVVELRDAAPDTEPEGSADARIQDIDLQLVVNTLWSAGAEAIAVGGERLVSTTAIRSAGGAILVNFHVLTSPYRIVALGDARSLERRFVSSEIAARFGRWAEIYGLEMTVRRSRRIAVQPFAGAVRSRYAVPAPAKGS